jgi:hypothetical protein
MKNTIQYYLLYTKNINFVYATHNGYRNASSLCVEYTLDQRCSTKVQPILHICCGKDVLVATFDENLCKSYAHLQENLLEDYNGLSPHVAIDDRVEHPCSRKICGCTPGVVEFGEQIFLGFVFVFVYHDGIFWS